MAKYEVTSRQRNWLNTILRAIVFAEIAMSMEESWPWLDDDFARRRKAYKFDENVQEILFQTRIDGFNTQKIECNGSGYYRCQLLSDNGGIIHIGNTFTKDSLYLQEFIGRNNDSSAPGYLFIEYQLDKNKTRINKIWIRIPNPVGKDLKREITEGYNMKRNDLCGTYNTKDQLVQAVCNQASVLNALTADFEND